MTSEKRTMIYLTMAHIGGLATVCTCLAFALDWPDFAKGFSIGVMVAPLIVMLLPRFRDEYIETLWQAGTALAFAAVVIGLIALPFLEGVYDGFTGNGSGQDIPAEIAGFGAIAAFYLGFHTRWIRGLR